MLPRTVSSLLVCLCVGASWVACVGDDPAATPRSGERLGSCFANDTCKEGLTCDPRERICVTTEVLLPDAADADAPREASVADASEADSDATSDAAALRCGLSERPGVTCPDAPCDNPMGCCIDPATRAHTCANNCAGAAKRFECDSPEACGASTKCCAVVASEGSGVACASRVVLEYSYCILACPGRVACRRDADCPVDLPRCVPTETELASGLVQVWGLCAP